MFEQLVLVDHPNIVKLHKYWLDASEARARVSGAAGAGEARRVGRPWAPPLAPAAGGARYRAPAGRLHHGVRVLGQPQAVPQKDQEEPQGHERAGMGSGERAGPASGTGRGRDAREERGGFGGRNGVEPGQGSRWGHHGPSRLSPPFRPTDAPARRQAWKRWCTQILSALR